MVDAISMEVIGVFLRRAINAGQKVIIYDVGSAINCLIKNNHIMHLVGEENIFLSNKK